MGGGGKEGEDNTKYFRAKLPNGRELFSYSMTRPFTWGESLINKTVSL